MIIGELYIKSKNHCDENGYGGNHSILDNNNSIDHSNAIHLYADDLVVCVSNLIEKYYTIKPTRQFVNEFGYVCYCKGSLIFIEERHIHSFIEYKYSNIIKFKPD